jgi:predicted amidohydrolase
VDHSVKTYPKLIPATTIVFHDYNKNNKDIVLGNTGVVAYCDKKTFIYDDTILVERDQLIKYIKKYIK